MTWKQQITLINLAQIKLFMVIFKFKCGVLIPFTLNCLYSFFNLSFSFVHSIG